MNWNIFNEVSEIPTEKIENSPLFLKISESYMKEYHEDLIENKRLGLEREALVKSELEKMYPSEKGFAILSEVLLRGADGKIVRDEVTGEARRVDFVVVKDGNVIDMIEVTSLTADKTEQCEKENRIRESGGNFVRDRSGNLLAIPDDIHTRIDRRA